MTSAVSTRFHHRESLRGVAARGKVLLGALDQVSLRQTWTRDELRQHQETTLQALLRHAGENVALWQLKFAAAAFLPEDFQSLEDLGKIPFLTKDELRNAAVGELVSRAHRPGARLIGSSGSTGIPSRMFRDEASLWHFTAQNTALYHGWCEGRPLSDVLYFVDMAQDSIDYALADLLRTTVMEDRILSVHDPVASHREKLLEFAPGFVSSYPSTIRNLAIEMHRRGEVFPHLRLLHLTSETLDAQTRRLIARVFPQARLIETYTCSEAGLIAYECMHDKRMHIAEDSVLCEIVDATGQATDGVGELVVTDLTNWSTPVIRYRGLGDCCRWENSPCPCGSPLRSIRLLEGRLADSIMRRDGSMASPLVMTNALDEVVGIYQYQIIQHEAGQFEILLVMSGTAARGFEEITLATVRALRDALRDDSAIAVKWVEAIPPPPGAHKVPRVISNVRRSE